MPSFNKENNEYHENIDASDGIATPGDFLLFVIYLFIPIATIIHIFQLFEAGKKSNFMDCLDGHFLGVTFCYGFL